MTDWFDIVYKSKDKKPKTEVWYGTLTVSASTKDEDIIINTKIRRGLWGRIHYEFIEFLNFFKIVGNVLGSVCLWIIFIYSFLILLNIVMGTFGTDVPYPAKEMAEATRLLNG